MKGKIVYYDSSSGQGIINYKKDKTTYFCGSSLKHVNDHTKCKISKGKTVTFKIYENAYSKVATNINLGSKPNKRSKKKYPSKIHFRSNTILERILDIYMDSITYHKDNTWITNPRGKYIMFGKMSGEGSKKNLRASIKEELLKRCDNPTPYSSFFKDPQSVYLDTFNISVKVEVKSPDGLRRLFGEGRSKALAIESILRRIDRDETIYRIL